MRIILMTVAVVATAACASGGGLAGDRNLVTHAEVDASDLATAYEIVRTMRPRWLRKVGPASIYAPVPVRVYIDGTRMEGPEALRTVPRIAVLEIRYYPPTEAQARWGLNHTHGAIAVATRRGQYSDADPPG